MSNTITGDEILLLNQQSEIIYKKVYELYHKRLYHYSYAITKSREEAEDIVMYTFATLWKVDKKFKREEELSQFVFVVTRNASITYCKKEKQKDAGLRELKYLTDDSEFDLFDGYEMNIIVQILDELIAGAPGKYGEVLRLHYLKKLKRDEIANELDMKVDTVSGHINYGTSKIVKHIKRFFDEE